MLKKVNRFDKKDDFDEVKTKGVMYQSSLFGCLVLKKDVGKKFGWIVSKKISKKAVERNRLKRLISESVRKNIGAFEEGVRVIFLVKKNILDKSLAEIDAEMVNIKNLAGI